VAEGCTLVLGRLGNVRRALGDTRLLGLEPGDLVGAPIVDLLDLPDRERLFEAMRGSFLRGNRTTVRCEVPVADGVVGVDLIVEPSRTDGRVEQWFVRCQPSRRSTEALERARLDLCGWAIDRGLRSGEFDLDFQPTVELATGATIGYEGFVRWARPGFGRLPAGRFLPAVEASGLMARLGRAVLERGVEQLAAWARTSPLTGLSLNVSPAEVARPGFAADVAKAVANAGIDPDRLVLELATGALRTDADELVRAMARLRRLTGVRLAVDDFGVTGALVPAHALPIDILKLDRSLTAMAARSPAQRALLGNLISLTRSLGTVVVGAGIESAAEREVLTAVGCEFGQGYLLGRPGPIDD
jgi:EAL domain-containing protein (putative c-di-GMP-specific phosphodiesterase class I)